MHLFAFPSINLPRIGIIVIVKMILGQMCATLFATIAVARAQHLVGRRHIAIVKSSQPSPRISFDPASVCFNPHFADYVFNDFSHTCPIPRPNSYYAGFGTLTRDSDCPGASKLICRPENSLYGDDRFLAPPRSWHGKGFVPLAYLPSAVAPNGRIDRKAIKYLKKLRNDLNSNPLLNQSVNGLCTSTAAKSAESHQDGKRTKRQIENKYRNFYPVQNIMYGDPINAPPRTPYERLNFIDAWRSK